MLQLKLVPITTTVLPPQILLQRVTFTHPLPPPVTILSLLATTEITIISNKPISIAPAVTLQEAAITINTTITQAINNKEHLLLAVGISNTTITVDTTIKEDLEQQRPQMDNMVIHMLEIQTAMDMEDNTVAQEEVGAAMRIE